MSPEKTTSSILAVFGDGQFQPCGAEDVAGIVRAHGKFRADRENILARDVLESRECLLGFATV